MGGLFFCVGRLALSNDGGLVFTALDAKIAFFSTEQRVVIAKTVYKSESVVRVLRY